MVASTVPLVKQTPAPSFSILSCCFKNFLLWAKPQHLARLVSMPLTRFSTAGWCATASQPPLPLPPRTELRAAVEHFPASVDSRQQRKVKFHSSLTQKTIFSTEKKKAFSLVNQLQIEIEYEPACHPVGPFPLLFWVWTVLDRQQFYTDCSSTTL